MFTFKNQMHLYNIIAKQRYLGPKLYICVPIDIKTESKKYFFKQIKKNWIKTRGRNREKLENIK